MKDLLRLGILASHGGSNMQAIIDAIERGELAAKIAIVISNNSQSGAIERAVRHGIHWRHISSVTQEGSVDGEDEAIRDALLELDVEVVLLAGYMKKIGPLTLGAFRGHILNIHPALLPKHGGAGLYGIKPHQAALAAGDTESGATVHVIDEEYDRGKILKQEKVPILPEDTAESLQQRVLKVEHQIYVSVLKDIIDDKIVLH